MTRAVVLGMLAWSLLLASGSLSLSRADQPPDFLALARDAIADPQTLATVHTMHADRSGQPVVRIAGRAARSLQLRRYALRGCFRPGCTGCLDARRRHGHVEGRVVHILDARDEDGFHLRLYFDSATRRLLMTGDFTTTSARHSHVVNGRALPPSAGERKNAVERITYGDYRRVNGIELPFSLSREISGRPVELLRVSQYEINPSKLDAAFKR